MKVYQWKLRKTALTLFLVVSTVVVLVRVLMMINTRGYANDNQGIPGSEYMARQATFNSSVFKLLVTNETDSIEQKDLKLSLQNSSMKLEDHLIQAKGSCLRKIFSDILLVVVYNFPFYASFHDLVDLYEVAFDSIVICGPTSSDKYPTIQVDHHRGYYAYQCLAQAIAKFSGFRGYLYINDDMIVNWWNFRHFSKSEIWLGAKIEQGVEVGQPPPSDWMWWSTWLPGMRSCEESLQEIRNISGNNSIPWMKDALSVHLSNNKGRLFCRKGWSDLYYIPGRLAVKYQTISNIFYKHRVFLEIAVPTMLTLLDKETRIEYAHGIYLPEKYGFLDFSDGEIFWKEYKFMLYFIHPFKYHFGNLFSRSIFRAFVVPYSYKQGYTCKC